MDLLQSPNVRSDISLERGARALRKDAVSEDVNQNNHRDLSELFHRLNNELGVILSHAELLEAKCEQDKNRSRAAQVVGAALEAMGTAREIRAQVNDLTLVK
jgi:signal transduction histidine kinase